VCLNNCNLKLQIKHDQQLLILLVVDIFKCVQAFIGKGFHFSCESVDKVNVHCPEYKYFSTFLAILQHLESVYTHSPCHHPHHQTQSAASNHPKLRGRLQSLVQTGSLRLPRWRRTAQTITRTLSSKESLCEPATSVPV